jgi:hypothetical protein
MVMFMKWVLSIAQISIYTIASYQRFLIDGDILVTTPPIEVLYALPAVLTLL